MHTDKDLSEIRNELHGSLQELQNPTPRRLWQYDDWVITMQAILDLDRIISQAEQLDMYRLSGDSTAL